MSGSGALTGRAVAVTGAAHGLGAAYARALAAHGAAVTVADIDAAGAEETAARITAAGGRASVCVGDVGDWTFGEKLVREAWKSWGRIDGLINNAGILHPAKLENIVKSDIDAMVRVNLMGTFSCGLAAIAAMREQPQGGSVINVTSGSQAGDIALSAYGATKAAIASLTYSWAMECRGSQVRINAISPLAKTAMAAKNTEFLAEQSSHREIVYTNLPDPEANAPLVVWLMTEAAAGVNGQVIRLAGRDLSYVTHPQIARPVLTRDWDVPSLAAAFRGPLGAEEHPLGISIEKDRT